MAMVSPNNSIMQSTTISPTDCRNNLATRSEREVGKKRRCSTDEDDALVGLGAALGAAEQLGHELHRGHVLEVRRHLLRLRPPRLA
jgi:hypothetical protein